MSETLERLRAEAGESKQRNLGGCADCGGSPEVWASCVIQDRTAVGTRRGKTLKSKTVKLCADCALKRLDRFAGEA